MKSELEKRKLPPLKSREELADILQKCVYGYLPKAEYSLTFSEPRFIERRYDCGNVAYSVTELTVTVKNESHTFKVDRLLHCDGKKRPLVINIAFHPLSNSQYFPVEEMSEYGTDFLSFCYKEVTSDDGNFEDGLAPLTPPAKSAPCPKMLSLTDASAIICQSPSTSCRATDGSGL